MLIKVVCIKSCYGTISYDSGTFCDINDVFNARVEDISSINSGIKLYDDNNKYKGYFSFHNFVTLDKWRDIQIFDILND